MIFRNLILMGLALSLSACLSLLPGSNSAPTLYRLDSNFAPVAQSSAAELVRVDRPSAPKILNVSDIVVSMDSGTLSVVANAAWAESIPSLIQSSLVEALATSPSFIGLTSSSGATTQTRLNLAVQNFEAKFDNGKKSAPLVIVSYRVTYTNIKDRKLLGTYVVERTQRAESINVSSIVSATETANKAVMLDIVNWMEARQNRSGS